MVTPVNISGATIIAVHGKHKCARWQSPAHPRADATKRQLGVSARTPLETVIDASGSDQTILHQPAAPRLTRRVYKTNHLRLSPRQHLEPPDTQMSKIRRGPSIYSIVWIPHLFRVITLLIQCKPNLIIQLEPTQRSSRHLSASN